MSTVRRFCRWQQLLDAICLSRHGCQQGYVCQSLGHIVLGRQHGCTDKPSRKGEAPLADAAVDAGGQ
jgi:hypothetical protein